MNDTREPDTDQPLAVIEPPELPTVDLTTMTLDQLGEMADAEHGFVLGSMRTTLAHAIRVGEILIRARELIDPVEWVAWKRARKFSDRCGNMYTRLATYQDYLAEGPDTIAEAEKYLVSLDLPYARGTGPLDKPAWMKDEAKRLRAEGVSLGDVADQLGVSKSTVQYWSSPEYRAARAREQKERKARQRAQRKALAEMQERQERDRLAKGAGGHLGSSYASLRKSLASLDASIPEASPEQRQELQAAMRAMHSAEDRLVAALKLGRAS